MCYLVTFFFFIEGDFELKKKLLMGIHKSNFSRVHYVSWGCVGFIVFL